MQGLDIGCSTKKLPGYVGMDIRANIGVDVVHDIENSPWPFDSESFDYLNASHVLEHLKPWKLMDIMNEAWRVTSIGGLFSIATPFGPAYAFDPTHCILFQESSFYYFDRRYPSLYSIYSPHPWEIVSCARDTSTCEMRTILKKQPGGVNNPRVEP